MANCHEQLNAWRHLGATFYAFFSSRHELLILLGAYLVLLLIPFVVARILDHKKK